MFLSTLMGEWDGLLHILTHRCWCLDRQDPELVEKLDGRRREGTIHITQMYAYCLGGLLESQHRVSHSHINMFFTIPPPTPRQQLPLKKRKLPDDSFCTGQPVAPTLFYLTAIVQYSRIQCQIIV